MVLDVAVQSIVPFKRPIGDFKPRAGFVITRLCAGGTNVLTGDEVSMSKRVNDTVDEDIRICLGKLDY